MLKIRRAARLIAKSSKCEKLYFHKYIWKLAEEQLKRVRVPRLSIFTNISYILIFFYEFDNLFFISLKFYMH